MEMAIKAIGSLSVFFGVVLTSGGIMGACFWTHVAHHYFPSVAGGVMFIISGAFSMRVARVEFQFQSEISVARSSNLLSIPVAVYILCCNIDNFMEFIGVALRVDITRPFGFLTDPNPNEEKLTIQMKRSPVLAVACIDVILLISTIIVLFNAFILLCKHTTLALDKEADQLLSWSSIDYRKTERGGGYENPAYGYPQSTPTSRPSSTQRVGHHMQTYPSLPRLPYIEDQLHL